MFLFTVSFLLRSGCDHLVLFSFVSWLAPLWCRQRRIFMFFLALWLLRAPPLFLSVFVTHLMPSLFSLSLSHSGIFSANLSIYALASQNRFSLGSLVFERNFWLKLSLKITFTFCRTAPGLCETFLRPLKTYAHRWTLSLERSTVQIRCVHPPVKINHIETRQEKSLVCTSRPIWLQSGFPL